MQRQRWQPNDCTSGGKMCPLGLEETKLAALGTWLGYICLVTYALDEGGCPVRCNVDELGAGYVRSGPPPSPSIQWCVFYSKYGVFQQLLLISGQWDPSGDSVVPPQPGV